MDFRLDISRVTSGSDEVEYTGDATRSTTENGGDVTDVLRRDGCREGTAGSTFSSDGLRAGEMNENVRSDRVVGCRLAKED
jgi:hypothetical protein